MTTDLQLDTFVALSVFLTGYPKEKLQPSLDTQKVAETYYQTLVQSISAETLNDLNATFLAIPSPTEATVKAALYPNYTPPEAPYEINLQTTDLATVSKNIIRMWFLGIWYTKIYPESQIIDEGIVISDITYKNGLVWGTMDAHPMGYSEFNFGYWDTAPAS